MSEKIDLQQEALNALKDAGLGSNSLRQASSKRGKQLSVNQPLTDSEARNIFINGAEDFYSLSANPQFSNVAELFDTWLTEHDRQLLAKTEGSVKPTLTYERGALIREEVQTFSLWPLLLNGYRYSKARGVHVQHQCSGCGS